MRRFYWLIIFSQILTLNLKAQTFQGSVVDSLGNEIVGAYIIHLESEHHTHSNHLGKFSFQHVHLGDTLEVRHVGFETKRIVVTDLSEPMVVQLQESLFSLDEVVVEKTSRSLSKILRVDLITNPVNSSQEILRKVPGLFVGQHAGGGKAEQIFLRGFDIDHGTDINITVDGMPVNMVSHAHGQGYADLHFLIPETIENVDFGKGPYYADNGNFATAGYVNFNTKDYLGESTVALDVGQFNTFRTLGLFDVAQSEKHNAYIAAEYLTSDGPFDAPQNFNRLNIMGKYSTRLADRSRLSLTASHFDSKWDASGQIPQRAVDAGMISRFGAIDSTEGGETSRTNLVLNFDRTVDDQAVFMNKVYYTLYDFELYSNFTFFLEDPLNGDQIRQKEQRQIFGLESTYNQEIMVNQNEGLLQVGVGFRNDINDDVELSRTRIREETLELLQLGDVNETNIFAFLNAEFNFGRWLINPGLRFDYFDFEYENRLDSIYNPRSQTKSLVSPKLSFIYNHSNDLQFFAKSGIGFHSNDTRVILQEDKPALPAAYGVDLGFIWKPTPRVVANVTGWFLSLEQEFVYVGDAGIVEPSGRSRRLGVDFSLRYQVLDWLFFDIDGNYAYARSVDDPENQQFIPLAPEVTGVARISVRKNKFSGGLQARYMGDRPANEDNSIVAEGYFVTDLNLAYNLDRIGFNIAIQNLFDTDWEETQFATNSRLQFEPAPVEEIHFTPGTPFFFKAGLQYHF